MASLKCLLILVMGSSVVLRIHGVSISSVAVTNTDSKPAPPSITKSLSMINIPQVPEFPKLAARPGKNQQSSPATSTNNQINPQQQQQQQSLNQQQQPQQVVQQSFPHPMQSLIPPFGLPLAFPSLPATQQEPELVESHDISPEEDHREDPDYSSETYHESSVEDNDVAYNQQTYEPVVTTIASKNESSTNKHAAALVPEKTQENNVEFPMPMHVMTILNALGSGGSLAQASKPEKDGVGQGYTTANAIGYATGDNATVTASVSNKMELNTQTVILTESASASASSMSNGTAFSQATLASNGYNSQFGPGGTGWKASNKNPGSMFV